MNGGVPTRRRPSAVGHVFADTPEIGKPRDRGRRPSAPSHDHHNVESRGHVVIAGECERAGMSVGRGHSSEAVVRARMSETSHVAVLAAAHALCRSRSDRVGCCRGWQWWELQATVDAQRQERQPITDGTLGEDKP